MQQIVKAKKAAEDEMMAINRFARRQLKQDEVYTFSVVLCDNEVDRDGEAFTEESLEKLAKMFVGKTGIFDHDPKGKNQTARIFEASVEKTGQTTSYGEPKSVLKARAYMVRSDRCKDLILEIDAGILKEVSVGCRVAKKACSICSKEYTGACGHVMGETYSGKLCFIELCDPIDAYEWSFVAVPAQPGAGVVKGFGRNNQEIEKQAIVGRKYLSSLRGEVVKLGYLSGFMTDSEMFSSVIEKMDEDELCAFKDEFSKKLSSTSATPQLANKMKAQTKEKKYNEDFKI